ncbi:MAG: FadR family transcriptional regulator, partial [Dehalococcoidia bacterium]|nr:FadR family transcriptional regulator [Dehalococcoidia bacterium]
MVSRDLLEQIVRGDLAVGSLLPREAELAAAYGVNRSVVREAIKLLEVHRLVRPTRRLGTVVLDPMASLTPEVLRAMLVRRDAEGARVDVTVLAGLLEIRAGLDVQMAALA